MSQPQDSTAELAAINSKFIAKAEGNTLPAVTLPDGSKIQTGTVGGLMMNIKTYDRLMRGESVGEDAPSKEELEHMLKFPIPTLKKAGLLDVFPPEDWLSGKSAGRNFVGVKAKEMGY